MAEEKETPDILEQARDAFVYAPLGLLYEYDDVMAQLVRRGKSQVQLAKLFGKMTSNREQVEKGVTDVADEFSSFLAKGFVELGQFLGLAPDTECGPENPAKESVPATPAKVPKAVNKNVAPDAGTTGAPKRSKTLPIAGYDSLTAKDIIRLLGDLSANQRKTIRAHEEKNRARKTVLSKLDRLDQ